LFRRSAHHHFTVLGHRACQAADATNHFHLLVVQREQ